MSTCGQTLGRFLGDVSLTGSAELCWLTSSDGLALDDTVFSAFVCAGRTDPGPFCKTGGRRVFCRTTTGILGCCIISPFLKQEKDTAAASAALACGEASGMEMWVGWKGGGGESWIRAEERATRG